MIITDDFVFIHYPKTGGTFVRKVVEKILRKMAKPILHKEKHGICEDIPKEYLDRPIVSCIRNPYDFKVSEFEFGWWKKLAPNSMVTPMKANYPHFPRLSFEEFVECWDNLTPIVRRNAEINSFTRTMGQYSQRFLKFFSHDYDDLIRKMDEEFMTKRLHTDYLYPVHFLRTNALNQDLHVFFRKLGYPSKYINVVLQRRRIYPRRWRHLFSGRRRKKGDRWESYYSPELKRKVRISERILFQMFPEFDV